MKIITHIKSVSIPVRNHAKALKFYTEKLSFKIVAEPKGDYNADWLELIPPNGQTKIVLYTPRGSDVQIGIFTNIVFTCEDLQQTYQELKSLGVEFQIAPVMRPNGSYAQFSDEDGNKFILTSQK